jgi:hypothetical protein
MVWSASSEASAGSAVASDAALLGRAGVGRRYGAPDDDEDGDGQ